MLKFDKILSSKLTLYIHFQLDKMINLKSGFHNSLSLQIRLLMAGDFAIFLWPSQQI